MKCNQLFQHLNNSSCITGITSAGCENRKTRVRTSDLPLRSNYTEYVDNLSFRRNN